MNKINIYLKDQKEKLKLFVPVAFDRPFFRDLSVRIVLTVSGIIFLSVWILSLFKFQPRDFLVPIRYNSFLGVTALGNWYDLYRIPGIMTMCFVLNFILALATYKKDKMISYIFIASNIFIAVIALTITINFGIITK